MKLKAVLSLTFATLMLTACNQGSAEIISEPAKTTSESTNTEAEYYLVRDWEGYELLESIFFCGGNHPLPFAIKENPDFTFENGILMFPDGSFAEAYADENGNIISLEFRADTSPDDFSIYGINFNAAPEDIYDIVGIPNSVHGSDENILMFKFFDGGITELTFIFTQKNLTEVHISA